MKIFVKKALKIILVFLISTIIAYLIFTGKSIYNWSKINYVPLFKSEDAINYYVYYELDSEYIKWLGEGVSMVADIMEEIKTENSSEENLALKYDSLGYAAWANTYLRINDISVENINISILLGVAITIAYIVIINKKIKLVYKILIGYIGIIIAFPPIYMYTWTYRFWNLKVTYLDEYSIQFYIVYTILFVLIYIVNYIIGLKIANDLNASMKKQDIEK